MIISGSRLAFANHQRLSSTQESGQFSNLLTGLPAAPPSPAAAASGDAYIPSGAAAATSGTTLGAQVLGYLDDFLGGAGKTASAATTGAQPATSATPGNAPDAATASLTDVLERTFGLSHISQISWSYDASQVHGDSATAAASQGRTGSTQSSSYQQAYDSYEQSSLSAQGSFTTSDGTSYTFSLDYERQRMTHVGSSVSSGTGGGDAPAADPGGSVLAPAATDASASTATADPGGGTAGAFYRMLHSTMLMLFDRNHDGKIDAADAQAGAGAATGAATAGAQDPASGDVVPATGPVPAPAPAPATSAAMSALVMQSRRLSLQMSVYVLSAQTAPQGSQVDAVA